LDSLKIQVLETKFNEFVRKSQNSESKQNQFGQKLEQLSNQIKFLKTQNQQNMEIISNLTMKIQHLTENIQTINSTIIQVSNEVIKTKAENENSKKALNINWTITALIIGNISLVIICGFLWLNSNRRLPKIPEQTDNGFCHSEIVSSDGAAVTIRDESIYEITQIQDETYMQMK
jgi:outer membrane murein-binding lipoprotein Lpp